MIKVWQRVNKFSSSRTPLHRCTSDVILRDFFDLGRPTKAKIHKDVLNLIQVFRTTVGGHDAYAKQPRVVKDIVRGQKDSLILARFRSAGDIQRHLETVEW
jgi:hypothetical protein